MTYVLSVLAAALVALAWDFQRRWFADRSRQRDHEHTRVLELVKSASELVATQKTRDERTERALVNFLTEQRDITKSLVQTAQKAGVDAVSKLQTMSRMGRK